MSFVELRADDYAVLSARVLGRMVAERRVSPVQLAELALALAKAAEPKINAYVSFLEPWALDAAGERECEARAGRLRSAIHGVPIAVKDNFYLKGFPLARGSRTSPDYVPHENAPMVERMLDAGAVIIGKTTTPEFGWKGTGLLPPLPPVRCRSRSGPTPAVRSASRPHSAA
jgi:aspartyl-tRNA(Asn)/glutamyl-tRNA(Gln) amidotransferase subunit A